MIRLREARIRKGISQKELSKEIQVAQNTISNWENGVREPSLDMLIKIADFLDCSTQPTIAKSAFLYSSGFQVILRFSLTH